MYLQDKNIDTKVYIMNKNYFVSRFKTTTIHIHVHFEYFILKNSSYIKSNINIISSLDKIQFQLTDKKINIKIAIF